MDFIFHSLSTRVRFIHIKSCTASKSIFSSYQDEIKAIHHHRFSLIKYLFSAKMYWFRLTFFLHRSSSVSNLLKHILFENIVKMILFFFSQLPSQPISIIETIFIVIFFRVNSFCCIPLEFNKSTKKNCASHESLNIQKIYEIFYARKSFKENLYCIQEKKTN